MLNRRYEVVIALIVMAITGGVSWWLMLRPVVDPDPMIFDALPAELNGWRSIDIKMDASVSEMLAADHNVQRAYLHPLGYPIFVYVGYYGTRRGGTPEHTPDVCYPVQGWAVVEEARRRVGGSLDGLDLRELVVEKDGERRLVHFWYRTASTSGLTSISSLRLAHVWGRLTRNRGDGALVRLSTPLGRGDIDATRVRLYGLDRVIEAELDGLWTEGALSP